MAQKTSWAGAVLSESDINTYLMHEGGAWSTYTPTLTQSGAVTKTVTYASWGRAGRFIYGWVVLAVTGSGTANNAITVGLPVAAAQSSGAIGSAGWVDSSSAQQPAILELVTTTTARLRDTTIATASLFLGQTGSSNGNALASPDTITYVFHYEAAS